MGDRHCGFCRSKPWFAANAHTHWTGQCSHLKKQKHTVCTNCGSKGHHRRNCEPKLRELDEDCPMALHFVESWRHPETEIDQIHHVFSIRCGAKLQGDFRAARRLVAKKMRKRGDDDPGDGELVGPANTRQRFHGTAWSCRDLVDDHECCKGDSSCRVCSIVRNGFDLSRVGETSKGHRYGE